MNDDFLFSGLQQRFTESLSRVSELLLFVRFPYAAGLKQAVVATDLDSIFQITSALPHNTSVVVLERFSLPIVGRASDPQVRVTAISTVRGDEEWLFLSPYQANLLNDIEFGTTNLELIEALDHAEGAVVRVGVMPPWWEADHEGMWSFVVPDEHGNIDTDAAY